MFSVADFGGELNNSWSVFEGRLVCLFSVASLGVNSVVHGLCLQGGLCVFCSKLWSEFSSSRSVFEGRLV